MFRKTTTVLAGAILALVTLASGVPVRAATVPTGFQEYHVIGQEQHVWDMFNRPVLGQAFVGYSLSNAMLSVVSVTASSANQIIYYYDHWEDNTDVAALGDTLTLNSNINTSAGAAKDLLIEDLFPVNGTYVPESMQRRLNAGPFTPFTDTGGDDDGTLAWAIDWPETDRDDAS